MRSSICWLWTKLTISGREFATRHWKCRSRDQRLGLTATPPDEPARSRLGELLGPIVYQLGIADLAGTWLADFDLLIVHLGLSRERTGALRRGPPHFHGGEPTIPSLGSARHVARVRVRRVLNLLRGEPR